MLGWVTRISRRPTAALVLFPLFAIIHFLLGIPLHLHRLIPSSRPFRTAFRPVLQQDGHANAYIHEAIRSLWCDDWIEAYVDARPPPGKIELTKRYENVVVAVDDQDFRQPAREEVSSSKEYLQGLQVAHAKFADTLPLLKKGESVFNGRGVVTTGGGEYYGPAIIQIQMLRKIDSLLPVEVFLKDKSEYEEHVCESYLPKIGATCVILSDILNDTISKLPSIEHYQVKLLAALFSSFDEFLFLDSDNIPLVDPVKELFNTEPYISSGFVSWPDFWAGTESPSFYTVAGLNAFPSNLPKRSSESGQMLVNKKTHIDALLLAVYYNIYGPDIYYPLLSQGAIGQGDKETLLAASVVLSKSYYRVRTPVESIDRDTTSVKISGMLQHHPADDLKNTVSPRIVRPAFIHSNTPKMNAGHLIDEHDLVVESKRVRLWGSKLKQIEVYGFDVEKEVWSLLVKTGCELSDKINEWKYRKGMCKRLKEHWNEVFVH